VAGKVNEIHVQRRWARKTSSSMLKFNKTKTRVVGLTTRAFRWKEISKIA
jgi:hypothetical protein